MRRTLKFDGLVYARSSVKDSGPPGEAEILELNPGRRELILRETEWPDLFPGTLNLKVDAASVTALCEIEPSFTEPPVTYPEKYASIPTKRGGYCYYRGRVKTAENQRADVLVRRCVNPHKDVVEILAPMKLRDALGVADGNTLNVRVRGNVTEEAVAEEKKPYAGPYIYDTDGKHVRIEGANQGTHAFLICSGPSFQTIDRGPLKFCWTLTTNNAAKACMPKFRPSAMICVDGADKFLYTVWQDPTVLKFVPKSHPDKWLWNSDLNAPVGKRVRDCPSVYCWDRVNGFDASRFLTERGCNWGNSKRQKDRNGVRGKRSVMLAAMKLLYVLGFRHVYLLGADFKMDDQHKYSFDQDRKPSSIKGNNSTYAQLQWRFEQLQPYFLAADFNVFNCNPESGLTAFPFLAYDEALSRALGFVHDWRAYCAGKLEATAGLYESKWYVCPQCGANMRLAKEDCIAGTASCACGRPITEADRKKFAKDQSQAMIDS